MPVQLKPQDVVVALKLATSPGPRPPIAQLARDLGMSGSEVHSALKRLALGHLYAPEEGTVLRRSLAEFLIRAVRYVYPARPGATTVGLPTAISASPLRQRIAQSPEDAMVWSWGKGTVRGHALEPLYKSVPEAAASDSELHELLALVDALRVGRARERKIAAEELERRLVR